MTKRRTIRRFAHELYPHGMDGEIRPLEAEAPYWLARAAGLDIRGTAWLSDDVEWRPRVGEFIAAARIALLADALLQGRAGQEAWEWATQYTGDELYEVICDRAVHYGVPVELIKPYPCGTEPDWHHHMASTGNITGYGFTTTINCPESECPACTEEVDGTG